MLYCFVSSTARTAVVIAHIVRTDARFHRTQSTLPGTGRPRKQTWRAEARHVAIAVSGFQCDAWRRAGAVMPVPILTVILRSTCCVGLVTCTVTLYVPSAVYLCVAGV